LAEGIDIMLTHGQYDEYRDYQSYYCKYQPAPDNVVVHRQGLWTIFGQYVRGDKDSPILDLGCGMGQWLMTLVERGYTAVEGVEISPQQYQACSDIGLKVYLVEDTIQFLVQHEYHYALITMFDVLEHIPKGIAIDLLCQVQKALRGKGKLVCTVPNANSIVGGRWRYSDWTHRTSFTEDSLQYVLLLAGFSNVRVCEPRVVPRWPWLVRPGLLDWYRRGLLRWIYRNLLYAEIGPQAWHIPLSYNLVGIGEA